LGLKTQSLAWRHRFPASSGNLSASGFEFFCNGDSSTFRSGVSSSGSPFSVPSMRTGVTAVIVHVRFGVVDGTA
jgi:hypothetical protein